MAFALRFAALLRDSLHIVLLSDFFVKRFYKKNETFFKNLQESEISCNLSDKSPYFPPKPAPRKQIRTKWIINNEKLIIAARAQKKFVVSFPRDPSILSGWQSFLITPETKTNSERSYKRYVLIRSERSQGERQDKRRARRLYENAWHCVAQAATQAKWHNKGTIPIYASAACLPRERRITL